MGDDISWLKDVFALNDTDVWAVGIFSTKQPNRDLARHNALHWDGRTWTIVDVPVSLPGTNTHIITEVQSVIAFDHNNVWFEGGSSIVFWNGKEFYDDFQISGWFPYGVFKMWGKNRNDVYLVGGVGAIAHYVSGKFIKIESGTTYDINDVWGVGDTVLCLACNWLFDNTDSHVYRLVNGKIDEVYEKGLDRGMKSLWFSGGMRKLTVVGSYSEEWLEEWDGMRWWRIATPTHWYQMCVRGNSPVDYFYADQRGGVAHFNGKSWKAYTTGISMDDYFMGLSCTPKNVWAVGSNDIGKLIIVHGTRK